MEIKQLRNQLADKENKIDEDVQNDAAISDFVQGVINKAMQHHIDTPVCNVTEIKLEDSQNDTPTNVGSQDATLQSDSHTCVATSPISFEPSVAKVSVAKSCQTHMTPVKQIDFCESETCMTPIQFKSCETAVTPIQLNSVGCGTPVHVLNSETMMTPVGTKSFSTSMTPVHSTSFGTMVSPVKNENAETMMTPIKTEDVSVLTNPVDSHEAAVGTSPIRTDDAHTSVTPVKSSDVGQCTSPVAMSTNCTMMTPPPAKVDQGTVTSPFCHSVGRYVD